MLEVELKQAVEQDAQYDQYDSAKEYLPVYLPLAASARNLAGIREGERNARDEKEQREYRVHKREPVPPGVLHMPEQRSLCPARDGLAERLDEGRHAHNDQHVEAPQGIQRKKSF